MRTSASVVHGDCLDVLRTLAPGSVACVVTDPPYGVGLASWDGAMPPQDVLDECLRVTRGPVVWFGAASMLWGFAEYRPRPGRVLVWHVTFSNSLSRQAGIYYRWHPVAVWRPELLDGFDGMSDVLSVPSEGRHTWDHPATKPLALMRQLVAACPGGEVCDPFCGSGTTGVACVLEGRDFLGIEREEAYVAIARRRIAEAQAQGGLFDADA